MIGGLTFTVAFAAQPAAAQTSAAAAGPADVSEVVVTGSRIHQAATDTAAPVETVTPQDFTDRGFVTAGQALNDLTLDGSGPGAVHRVPATASGNGQDPSPTCSTSVPAAR